jgi:hypothetical protein
MPAAFPGEVILQIGEKNRGKDNPSGRRCPPAAHDCDLLALHGCTELFASHAVVTTVKTTIPWGFLLLIPALTTAGGSGFTLARGRRAGPIGAKIKRMPLIAANGVLVLIPSALFLAFKARADELDGAFYAVQR